jgi:hypothetical protein
MTEYIRIFLSDGSIIMVPRTLVAMSLVNDWPYNTSEVTKVIRVPNAFANGDDVEITVKRIPK